MKGVGCWFAQLCYYPVMGAFVFVVMWTLCYCFIIKATDIRPIWSSLSLLPLSCLLLGVVGVGYWIYIIKEFGLFYSQTVSYLIMLIVLYITRIYILKHRYSSFIVLLIAILLYPALGWYSFFFVCCSLPMLVRTNGWSSSFILLTFLTPVIYKYTIYSGCSNEVLWRAGFPLFDDKAVFLLRQSVPYIMLALFTIGLFSFSAIIGQKGERSNVEIKQYKYYILTCTVSAIAYIGVWQFMFKDYNYLAEMRMVRYSLNDEWENIIREAETTKRPSRTMVLLKNIALMNTGELGNKAFQLSCDGRDIKNPEGLSVYSMYIAAPVIYYNFGKIIFATRWATELAVPYGYSPFFLMNLCRSALAKGEYKAADRYKTLLHGHMFYNDWNPKPETLLVKELDAAFADVLDNDGNNAENYLVDIFSKSYESDWASVREVALFHAMLTGHPDLFWKSFMAFVSVDPSKLLPIHYQEAYCYFMEKYPIEMPFKVKINDSTVQSYISFRRQLQTLTDAGYDNETIGESLRSKWGGTYWWHVCFGRSEY